jgi:hypothetical protein
MFAHCLLRMTDLDVYLLNPACPPDDIRVASEVSLVSHSLVKYANVKITDLFKQIFQYRYAAP